MKIQLWSIGKANEPFIKDGVADFTNRISKYFPVSWQIISHPKNAGLLSQTDLRKKEASIILQMLKPEDFLVALDERGKEFTSEKLASFLQTRANESTRSIVFLIGGAYGIDDALFVRSGLKWSLSQLTFPHQLVRLILAEQLYRACTILRNEKYHHG